MIDSASWPRVRRILESAMDCPPHRRERLLDRACRGDDELRRQVNELLSHAPADDTWLDSPVPGAAPTLIELSELLGRTERVGNYRIMEPIAVGGMGVVLRAVDETAGRVVAIKIIRSLASPGMLRAFRREQRLLAQLDHPAITRLLETGLTPEGLPYIVMEYVEGRPIDEHIRLADLSIEDRLELFRSVCLAVHFAHQNLVVHRDLKPANILVIQSGQIKLLDFGIAKLLDRSSQGTVTETLAGAMTLRYSSPEQIRGEPITTATDVYSLGVILYELLTGRAPYELASRSRYEAEKIICESRPPSPSAAARTAESDKAAWPASLDHIVMMALHKDPAGRYTSAEQFADDISRYLGGLDIRAHQPSRVEWAVGVVKRHRLATALLAASFVIISTLAVISSLSARAANAAKDREMEARLVAERISGFTNELLAAAGPKNLGRAGAGLHVLEEASALAQRDLKDHPDLAAGIYHQIGQTYYHLRRSVDAERSLRLALHNYRLSARPDPQHLADCLGLLGGLLSYRDNEEGLTFQREAVSIVGSVHGEDSLPYADALHGLAFALTRCARPPAYHEAEEMYLRTLAIRRSHGAAESASTAVNLHALAALMRHQNRLDEADRYYKQSLEMERKVMSPLDDSYVDCLNDYALCLQDMRRYDDAEALLRETLRLATESFDDIAIADAMTNLGRVARARGDLPSARNWLHQSLAQLCRFVAGRPASDVSDGTRQRCRKLAESFSDESVKASAFTEFLDIVPVSNRASHIPPCACCHVLQQLAGLSVDTGDFVLARQLSQRAIEVLDRYDAAERLTRAHLVETLAEALYGCGQVEQARKMLGETVETLRLYRGPVHRETIAATARLDRCA
ncbi:MAG TPA: serine/threonine-protein kinase, partial [Phycisphaerae bacterium]|nr:serine/threonine-protein kinase [Phycisphaerae bacterium]